MRGWLFALVVLVGCRRATPQPTESRPLLVRYPIRPHVRWTEHRDRGGVLTKQRREERWTVIGDGTWDVVTTDVETGTPFYRARYSLLLTGLAQTAVLDGGKSVTVEPPRVALPLNTAIGNAWEATHRVGTQQSHRACKLVAYDKCQDGVEQQCTTTYGDGRIVDVHNRYCGGVGMVGYSSTTRRIGTDEVVRIWSEELADVVDTGP